MGRHIERDAAPTPAGLLPPGATTPQIVVVTVLTLLAMAVGLLLAALFGDLMMSNRMPGHGSQGAELAPGISQLISLGAILV
ncbi:MAG: hypothetical protein M3542_03435 [Acidobacteriota bacterium]|nr:hypothetical protein [Acidobacteriota bacterium]MDQ5870685.1 hypothetical protein [Acidobacteriota bacterium]